MKNQNHNDFNSYDFFIKNNIEKGNGNNIALIDENNKISYKSFKDIVENKYRSLFSSISNCKRCLLVMHDSICLVVIYYGLLNKKISPGIINYNLSSDNITKIIKKGKYDLVLTDNYVKKRLNNNKSFKELNFSLSSFEKIFIFKRHIDNLNKNGDFIIYSSGSTGVPKGIIHSQYDMYFAAISYGKEILKFKKDDIIYPMSSLNYAFSFSTGTFQSFFSGSTTLILQSNTIFDIVKNINKYKPTVICGVPSIFKLLLKINEEVCSIDLSSVRLFLSSGESLPINICEKWYETFKKPIVEGYGSAEMLAGVISNSNDDYVFGSTGKKVNGYSYILDSNNVLTVEGESVSNRIIGTDEFNSSKYYKTQDVFKINNNRYWFCGRSDDLFKHNGIWLNPNDIENVILNFDIIEDCYIYNFKGELMVFFTSNVSNENILYNNLKKIYLKLRNKFDHSFTPNLFIKVKSFKFTNGKKVREFIDSNRTLRKYYFN